VQGQGVNVAGYYNKRYFIYPGTTVQPEGLGVRSEEISVLLVLQSEGVRVYEPFKLEFCLSRVIMMMVTKSVTVSESRDICSASRDSHVAQQYITHLFPCLHFPTSTWAEPWQPRSHSRLPFERRFGAKPYTETAPCISRRFHSGLQWPVRLMFRGQKLVLLVF
jgi:hypothetical protein